MNCNKKRYRTLVLAIKYAIIESVEIQKEVDSMEKLDNNAHSVFLLYYHLIMVVKYRRKAIDDPISERAKEIFSYIAPNYGIRVFVC